MEQAEHFCKVSKKGAAYASYLQGILFISFMNFSLILAKTSSWLSTGPEGCVVLSIDTAGATAVVGLWGAAVPGVTAMMGSGWGFFLKRFQVILATLEGHWKNIGTMIVALHYLTED